MKCQHFFEVEEEDLQSESFQAHQKECQACQSAFKDWETVKSALVEMAKEPANINFQNKIRDIFILKRKRELYAYAGFAAAAVLLMALLFPKAKPPISLHEQNLAMHLPLPKEKQKAEHSSKEMNAPLQEKQETVKSAPTAKRTPSAQHTIKRRKRKKAVIRPKKREPAMPAKEESSQDAYEEYVIRIQPQEREIKIQIETGEGAYLEGKTRRSFSYTAEGGNNDLLFPVMARAGSRIKVKVVGKEMREEEFQIQKLHISQENETPVYPGKVLSFEPIESSTKGEVPIALGRLTPKPITVDSLKGALMLKKNSKLVFPDMEVSLSSFQILPENGEG